MIALDYAILGVFAVSMLLSAMRGAVRELVGLGGWVMAFLAANLFAGPFSQHIPALLQGEAPRTLAAYVGVFVFTLILASLAGMLLGRLMKAVGLGALDRLLGALFGFARGLILVLALGLVAGMTSAPQQAFWQQSYSGPWLVSGVLALQPWLPSTLALRLRYD